MEFRDLKRQYQYLKPKIDQAIIEVCSSANFIHGYQVEELEERLAEYIGVRHCITCANGTDALQLALMCWNVGDGDAVFVPDFTFFSTGEAPAMLGATPVFVDVDKGTYNIDCTALEEAILSTIKEGKLVPKVIISVDLFGQPADYIRLKEISKKYNLYILEDSAQGFGGSLNGKKACSFGDISTTSFFPAKPLGCYGDGGAIFTDNDDWNNMLRSLCVHGKGSDKYDNIYIGLNSRLDTIQAAILKIKLDAFIQDELQAVNENAKIYTRELYNTVEIPIVKSGCISSWAQYTIKLPDINIRNKMKKTLGEAGIPTAIYYLKPMHEQVAFQFASGNNKGNYENTISLCNTVLSLPIHPYMEDEEIVKVVNTIKQII